MAGLNVGDTIRCDVVGSLFGQQIISTFAYRIIIESTDADPIAASTSWANQWQAGAVSPYTAFLNCCPPQYTANQIRVQKIRPVRFSPGVAAVADVGQDLNNTENTNSSAVITRAASLSGRRFVGSLHLPGLAAGNMDNGSVALGFLIKMGTLASRMLNDFTDLVGATKGVPVLVHKTGLPADSALTRAITQQTVRVMRRRTVGVGK